MRKVKGYYIFGDTEIHTESDYYDFEYLDTTISINGAYICTIEGNKIAECIGKLQTIIDTYRI
jgi:hypothetical protein